MLAGSKKEKHLYHFSIARALSSAAPIQRRVYQMFAEVYLWASAVFCARPSLQRNSIGTATKMRNPKLVGSLSMHQRSVSLPFHRKPIGTRTKMDNPKLVGGLSMSFQSSHFPNFPNESQCCHLRPVCTHWALLSVDMLPKIAHACSFMGLEKGLDLA